MAAFTRFAQQIHGAACHHFTAMAHESFQHFFQIQSTRLVVYQRYHVDAKHGLHLRLCVQIIEQHFARFIALHFDNDTHAVFV